MAQVFPSEMCETFKSTFENSNNFVEHLRTAARVKSYLEIADFLIMSYHSPLRAFVK